MNVRLLLNFAHMNIYEIYMILHYKNGWKGEQTENFKGILTRISISTQNPDRTSLQFENGAT